MADIRINSLPSTATSFNTDDYIAIDGASGGTRKMLAANPPFSDVTLGTSGPSVKSSLSARAPRQGLVFDGTSQASVSTTAIGTTSGTIALWLTPDSISNGERYLSGTAGVQVYVDGSGKVNLYTAGGTVTTNSSLVVKKSCLIVFSINGTTATPYFNGVVDGSPTTIGSVNNFTAIGGIGSNFASGYIFPLIYNRALSASEVVTLYEAGAPAGADYNSASNTGIITGQNNTFNGGIGNWTSGGTGTVAAGTNVMNCTAGSNADNLAGYLTFVNAGYNPKGYYVRVTADITNNSGTVRIGVGRAVLTQIGSLAGNGTFDATAFIPATTDADSFWICGATSSQTFTVDNFQVFRLGLLLAPDAAQAGGGLAWYDTSGNAANITLPASGVSWNVPSSRVLGGAWTVQGNLSVNANQVLQTATSDTIYAYNQIRTSLSTGGGLFGVEGNAAGSLITGTNAYATVVSSTSSGTDLQFGTSGVVRATIGKTTGNFLIGTTTDGGQKLQVSGSAIFGSTNTAQLSNPTGQIIRQQFSASTVGLRLEADSANGHAVIGTSSNHSLLLRSNDTTALTIDTSQNATFAGNVTVGNSSADSGYTLRFTKAISGTFPRTDKIVFGSQELTNGSAAILGVQTAAAGAVGYLEFKTTTSGGVSTTALTLDATQKAIFAGKINAASLPTSASGLSAGDIWNDSGTLKIV